MKTDSELQRDVLDELKWEPSINSAHIGVSVNDGIVTLSGHVSSYWERYVAERAAKTASMACARSPTRSTSGFPAPAQHRRGHRRGLPSTRLRGNSFRAG